MPSINSYVRARIDTDTKQRATEALDAMGISVSDAIRLLMIRVADERRLPFEIKAPNKDTQKAMNEFDNKKAVSFDSVNALMEDINAVD